MKAQSLSWMLAPAVALTFSTAVAQQNAATVAAAPAAQQANPFMGAVREVAPAAALPPLTDRYFAVVLMRPNELANVAACKEFVDDFPAEVVAAPRIVYWPAKAGHLDLKRSDCDRVNAAGADVYDFYSLGDYINILHIPSNGPVVVVIEKVMRVDRKGSYTCLEDVGYVDMHGMADDDLRDRMADFREYYELQPSEWSRDSSIRRHPAQRPPWWLKLNPIVLIGEFAVGVVDGAVQQIFPSIPGDDPACRPLRS